MWDMIYNTIHRIDRQRKSVCVEMLGFSIMMDRKVSRNKTKRDYKSKNEVETFHDNNIGMNE